MNTHMKGLGTQVSRSRTVTSRETHLLRVPDVMSSVTRIKTLSFFSGLCPADSHESYNLRMLGCWRVFKMATSSLKRACSALLYRFSCVCVYEYVCVCVQAPMHTLYTIWKSGEIIKLYGLRSNLLHTHQPPGKTH